MAWKLIRPTEAGMKEWGGDDSSPEVNGVVYSMLQLRHSQPTGPSHYSTVGQMALLKESILSLHIYKWCL